MRNGASTHQKKAVSDDGSHEIDKEGHEEQCGHPLLALVVSIPARAIAMNLIQKSIAMIVNLEMKTVDRSVRNGARTHRRICSTKW